MRLTANSGKVGKNQLIPTFSASRFCRCTLRKIAQTMPTEEELIGVEDQWLEEQDSMLKARERDGEETEITL